MKLSLKLRRPKSAIGPAMAGCGLAVLGNVLVSTTHLYLIEQFVCREYYTGLEVVDEKVRLAVAGREMIDETLCKEPAIQASVATIQGVFMFSMFFPALVMAGPWAQIARSIGKKPVVFLNACSLCASTCYYAVICYFPQYFNIRWIWAMPIFDIIGGGSVIINSLTYTYLAEEVELAELSSLLYKFTALQLTSAFLAMTLASYLLRISVWTICLLGISAMLVLIPVTLLLPDDIPYDEPNNFDASNVTPHAVFPQSSSTSNETSLTALAILQSAASSETTSLLSTTDAYITPSKPITISIPHVQPALKSKLTHILSALSSYPTHTLSLYRQIFVSNPLSQLTLLTFFLLNLTAGIHLIFTQWASIHHAWSIADVHVLTSFEMIISSLVLLSLPFLSRFSSRSTTAATDLFLAKLSLLFVFLGLLAMALAPTRIAYVAAISVFTLGSGLLDSLRSFATGLVGAREEVERLYLGLGMMTTLGGMAASAVWSGVLSLGIGKGWVVERMPFWGVLGGLCAVGVVILRLGRWVPSVGVV